MTTLLLWPSSRCTEQVQSHIEHYHCQQKRYYDKPAHNLPSLEPQETVRIQTPKGYNLLATVMNLTPGPQSYIVTENGKVYSRNHRHLLYYRTWWSARHIVVSDTAQPQAMVSEQFTQCKVSPSTRSRPVITRSGRRVRYSS